VVVVLARGDEQRGVAERLTDAESQPVDIELAGPPPRFVTSR